MTKSDPSWTKPGDGVSMSIGVTFYTKLTRKHAQVHQINEVLRRFGFSPTLPGISPLMDSLKAPLERVIGSARYRRRGLEPPPGAY